MADEPAVPSGTDAGGSDSGSAPQDYSSVFDAALPSDTTEASPAPVATKTEPTVKTEVAPKAQAPKAEAEEDDPFLSVQDESEHLRNAWKLPEIGKDLRKAYYMVKDYQKHFPTVEDARTLRELIPSVEDAKRYLAESQVLRQFEQMFYSKDASNYEKIFGGMRQHDPEVFSALAESFPQVHYKLDPEGYRKDTQQRFADVMVNMREMASAQKDEELVAALDLISGIAFGGPAPKRQSANDPRDQKIADLERQLGEDKARASTAKFEEFFNKADQSAAESARSAISSKVDAILPKDSVSARTRERIIEDIYNEVDSKLKSNNELKALLKMALTDGHQDEAHMQRVSGLVLGRAEAIIPEITRTVVKSWTNDILRLNQEELTKAKAAAVRREPGAGGTPSTPSVKLEDIKGLSITDAYDKLLGNG